MHAALPRFAGLVVLACCLAACITREPSPQEVRSKQFEAVAGMSVVYLYRDRVDFTSSPASFTLDEQHQGATYRGTYFRLEMAPGKHRIAGFAADIGHLDFITEAGRIYFIRHSVTRLHNFDLSVFQIVPAEYGRPAVLQYEMNGAP